MFMRNVKSFLLDNNSWSKQVEKTEEVNEYDKQKCGRYRAMIFNQECMKLKGEEQSKCIKNNEKEYQECLKYSRKL